MPHKKTAIIGAGWYGCHLARVLSKQGFDVTLYERNDMILNEISGNFGVRLHLGLHYPRSDQTRENCIDEYDEFLRAYPELVNHHEHSVYGLGKIDANGYPSKVPAKAFEALVSEHPSFKVVDPQELGYKNLHTAIDTTESSIVVGKKLRSKFNEYLAETNVKIKLNTTVDTITREVGGRAVVSTQMGVSEEFDSVINATSYHRFLPNRALPFDIEIAYQVCAGLLYEDLQEKEKGKASPFIVMDGWFPCLMLYNDGEQKDNSQYIVIHGKWTILRTCATTEEANKQLSDDSQNKKLQSKVEQECNEHLSSFYPEFSERFKYIGWKLNVLAKPITEKEFRSTILFQDSDTGIIHIIPGKVGGIASAAKEALMLLEPELNVDGILSENGYRFVINGVLDKGRGEVCEKPIDISRNTSGLQTADAICSPSQGSAPSLEGSAVLPYELDDSGSCKNGPVHSAFFERAHMKGKSVGRSHTPNQEVGQQKFLHAGIINKCSGTLSFFDGEIDVSKESKSAKPYPYKRCASVS